MDPSFCFIYTFICTAAIIPSVLSQLFHEKQYLTRSLNFFNFLHCKSVQKMNTSVPELCPSQYYIHPFSVHKCFQSLLSLSLFFLHLFIPPSYHICCLVYPHTQHLSPSASMHVSVPPSPTPSFSPFIQVLI